MQREPRPETGIMVTVLDMTADLEETLVRINASAVALDPDARQAETLSTDTLGYVIKGDDLYVICTEGVGSATPVTDDDPIVINLRREYPRNEDGSRTFEMFSPFNARLTRTTILGFPVKEEIPLESFIRSFGARLESNFYIWHRVLS